MSDSIKEGVGLEPTAGRNADAERDLLKAMKHYQAGERQEALSLVRPWADQGDPRACLLVAKLYKDEGDVVRCRNYLYAAGEGGDGDAALMLAQEYVSEDPVVALEWAEKAHAGHIPGAGRLILRLAEAKGSWKEVVRLAAEELAWLDEAQGRELQTELTDVLLNGNHLSEEEIVEVLRPIVDKLPEGSSARLGLNAHVKAIEDRWEERDEKEKKAKRKAAAAKVGKSIQPLVDIVVAIVAAIALNVLVARIIYGQDAQGLLFLGIWLLGGACNCVACGWVVTVIHKLMRERRLAPLNALSWAIGPVVVLMEHVWAIPLAAILIGALASAIEGIPAVREFLSADIKEAGEISLRSYIIILSACWGAASPYSADI